MTILHIDSAITGEGSVSRSLTTAIVSKLAERTPDATIVHRDLVADPLPHFAGTPDHDVLEEYLAAEAVVIGAPLYNFGIPSQLKAWIDRILVAGKTFSYGAEGPIGLAPHIRVVVVTARGGFYGPDSSARPNEHGETYLAAVFGFLGITPEFVIAEGVAVSPEQRETALADARARIAAF